MDDRNQEGRQPPPDETTTPTTTTTSPYNLWFAWSALGAGLVAYAITMWIFGAKFDAAAATGALGALFTLIGTVSGAYFGVKSSSDTADRAKEQVDEAHAATERANRSAKAALLEVDPNKSEQLRAQGIV